ncbi:MAG: hypothetical protein IPO94_17515 [Saprospiraceae bacterium]|nr:hypothetical protein [Saprospiraceae bacterium]
MDKGIEWLPAVVVRGEGVFFEFNDKRLKEWGSERGDKNEGQIFYPTITIDQEKERIEAKEIKWSLF